jgi:hypothetical protein
MFVRVLIGCVALYALAFASQADEPKETKLKPTLVLVGTHSAIRDEKLDVVTNEKDWKRLWSAHQGEDNSRLFVDRNQTFDPDFDSQYVAVVFFGDGPPFGKVTPRQRGDTVIIGYEGLYYQTEGRDRRPDIVIAKDFTAAPYALVLLPKPVKTVVFEENVQEELGKPPIWKEQKRFPAPKEKK